ncbi:MAG: methylmalonyl Co-A mutase-associated GTPase MeaB [Chloroflexi bacterium]|nr:methylmalonyl Co-A mutase-associated GTPase MeaB [Chloroflexota bacterium]MBI5712418.1 methylmalonyl Co-A mutase-associated GTPase MeaB [Chloroflexota bacterium]
MTLHDSILSGDRRALARLITKIENDQPESRAALAALYPRGGRAQVIGVTGAPGTGKSTLVSELAKAYRRAAKTVAIIAVDPTSPFTGGAILGDRIRMRDLSGDEGVFIRSMATRGSLGGLARATDEVVAVVDAAAFDVIMIETVGAGQSEVDIARLAHTTLVVEAPGLGDDVQAIKAGILEIADVLVLNKADLPGAEAATRALRGMLMLAHTQWDVPICETVAAEGKGIDEVIAAIDRHRNYLLQSDGMIQRERDRVRRQLENLARDLLYSRFIAAKRNEVDAAIEAVASRQRDPYSVVDELLK